MKFILRLKIFLAVLFLFSVSPGYSYIYYPSTAYDYSDAAGYGSSWHRTGEWQWLGDSWDSEYSVQANDSSDDGVWWSTDSGQTWGHDAIYAGLDVTFRFDMHRAPYGIHEYDQLKAWIDWDGDYQFDYGDGSLEEIIAEQWFKEEDGDTQFVDAEWLAASEKPNPEGTLLYKEFFTTVTVPQEMSVGDVWLRALVTCTDTKTFAESTPYGYYYQGETEDWRVRVVPAPVPEPSTIVLLLSGLGGLFWYRRRQ